MFRRVLLVCGVSLIGVALAGPAQASHAADAEVKSVSKHKNARVVIANGKVTAVKRGSISVKRQSGRRLECRIDRRSLPDWVEKGARVKVRCKGRHGKHSMVEIQGRGSWKIKQRAAEAKVEGTISGLVPAHKDGAGSITVVAGDSSITCVIAKGSAFNRAFAVGDTVEAKCRLLGGISTLERLEHEDEHGPFDDDEFLDDELEMKGTIGELTGPTDKLPGSIVVAAGKSSIVCVVPAGSLLVTSFAVGDIVEAKCELVGGEWLLTRIELEDDLVDDDPFDDEREVKGTIDGLVQSSGKTDGSIVVGKTSCGIAAGSVVAAGFSKGDFVEAKCELLGGEWLLTRLQHEDGIDNDGDHDRGGRDNDSGGKSGGGGTSGRG